MQEVRFVWLELTGRCPLLCDHCYADSGPKGVDGAMLPKDWLRVIDEVAQLGGRMVQFIGGEPTLHRSLPAFVDHALAAELEVEVFSNLVHVSPQLWEVFAQPGVRLATSYYSDNATEHEAITKSRNSYARTKANIIEALRRSIPLRVGLINVQDGQRVEQARAELEALGVTEIGLDRLRQVGRGVRDQQPSVEQLCGRCADGVVAISPDGSVWPCVFARWLAVGNIRESSLCEIVDGALLATTRTQLQRNFTKRQCGPDKQKCAPESRCDPSQSDCKPNCPPGYHCGPKCAPDQCWPGYYCAPDGYVVLIHSVHRDPLAGPYNPAQWPFTLPSIRKIMDEGLCFTQPVTFLVGENGSGKSTVLEAIAEAQGVDARGGSVGRRYAPAAPKSDLARQLVIELTAHGARTIGRKARGYHHRHLKG